MITNPLKDALPYNKSMAKACMQTIKHGGTRASVFTAASVLADMTVSVDSTRVMELLDDGLLETITSAFIAEYEPSEESRKIQGRTLFQLLRVLQNLSDFPIVADTILTHDHRKLVHLLVESGFSIELGAADSWVQPLSDIFAALFKSELAAASNSMPNSHLLDMPHLCNMLTNRILPYYDPYTSTLGERLIESLSSYFSSLSGSPSEKIHQLNSAHPRNQYLKHHNKGRKELQPDSNAEAPPEVLSLTFADELISLTLQAAQVYWTVPFISKQTESTTRSLGVTLNSIASLLSEQESQLLALLESDHASRRPTSVPEEEFSPRESIFYVVDSNPWYCSVKRDAQNAAIVDRRSNILNSFRSLVTALPPSPGDATSVNELLKTLLLATTSLDTDLMFSISRRGTWLQDLIYTWPLVESSSMSSIRQNSSHQAELAQSNSSTAADLESWEVCPVRRPSLQEASTRVSDSIRRRSVELLSRLSSIPDVASKISITRCLCGIQLEHGPVDNSVSEVVESGNSSTSIEENEEDEDLQVAKRTIEQLRPIQKIVRNIARYAPEHITAVHLERIVTMNPSEMESLTLLSNITSNKHVSEIVLSDHLLSYIAFSRLETASKLAPYTRYTKRRVKQQPPSIQPLPIAEDEYVHFTTRLALQTVSNLAKSNPELTLSKLTSSNGLSFLQRCVASTDHILRGLSVLTFARLQSTIAKKEDAQRRTGKRVSPTIDPNLLEGVDILFPTSKTKRAPNAAQSIATPEYEVITDANFDVVFIHGINGHPITTWRVEDPNEPQPARITPWPKPTANKTKEHVDQTYHAYIDSLSDPEKAMRDAEAEQAICWPRDWMPLYLPGSRILTVSYDIALTKWSASETMPLKRRAAEILTKLRLLGIGEKPVIFVAHSFGGLIVKEMLQESSKMAEYRDILDKTLGIIFFSTPHRGSILAGYANGPTDYLFRGSSAVAELYPSNWYLYHFNAVFPKVAPHIPTLSIGEIETCFLEGLNSALSRFGAEKYTCYQIVPDESSNPEWGGPNHEFIKLLYNHRQVCKPESYKDERFQIVLNFFKKYAPSVRDAIKAKGRSIANPQSEPL